MSQKKGLFASLFGGGKSGGCCSMEIVEEESGCCCGGSCCGDADGAETEQEDILVLEPGCKDCQELDNNVKETHEKNL